MKVTIPGYTSLTGSPKAILSAMKDALLFGEDMDIEKYMKEVKESTLRCFHVMLDDHGETLDERAENLLISMADNGIIMIEEV